MTTKWKTVGRRFTRREVDAGHHLERIDSDRFLSATTIGRHKAAAIETLEAAGIPATAILAEHPGGSMLRDRVLNYLQREPDSKEGMACQICELCIRLEVLPTMGAPAAMLIGDAYRLGRLVILAKAYGIDGEQSRVAAKAPRPGRRDPLRTKIIEAMRPLRRNDLTLLAALKAMQTAAHNGLTVSFLADADRYEVIDEDDLNDSAGTYGIDALERMWTAAKK